MVNGQSFVCPSAAERASRVVMRAIDASTFGDGQHKLALCGRDIIDWGVADTGTPARGRSVDLFRKLLAVPFFVVVWVRRNLLETMLFHIGARLLRMFLPRFSLLSTCGFGVFRTLTLFGRTIGRTIGVQLFRRHRGHAGIVSSFGTGFVALGIAFVKERLDLVAVVLTVALFRCAVSRLTLLRRTDTWATHRHLH